MLNLMGQMNNATRKENTKSNYFLLKATEAKQKGKSKPGDIYKTGIFSRMIANLKAKKEGDQIKNEVNQREVEKHKTIKSQVGGLLSSLSNK